MEPSRKTYIWLLILACFIAGFAATIVKAAYDTVPPILMLTYRFMIAFIMLAVLRGRVIIRNFRGTHILPVFLISLVMTAAYIVFNLSMKYTTVTNATFLYGLSVLVTPFMARMINGTKLRKKIFIGIAVAIAGMYLLIMNGGSFSMNIGDLLGLASAVIFSLQVVLTGKYVSKIHPLVLTDLQFLMTGIMSFIASLAFGENISPHGYGLQAVISLIFLGVVATALFFLLQTYAQTKVDESTVAIIYTFIPFFSTMSAWLLLGETLTLSGITGGILIIIGIIFATIANQRKEKT